MTCAYVRSYWPAAPMQHVYICVYVLVVAGLSDDVINAYGI